MGETSTDSPASSIPPEYKTLEREMESVKAKIETIVVENQCLKSELERSAAASERLGKDAGTQTTSLEEEIISHEQQDVEMDEASSSSSCSTTESLRQRIIQLEAQV